MSHPHDNCPNCNADWNGEPIPEDIREHYSPPYYWRREIGIDGGMLGIYDGIVAYQCPDCKHEFPRSNHPLFLELFERYKALND